MFMWLREFCIGIGGDMGSRLPMLPLVGPIFGFEDDRRLVNLHGVPCSLWNLAAVVAVSRAEGDAFCFGVDWLTVDDVLSVDYFIKFADEADDGLGGVIVLVDRHHGIWKQGVEHALAGVSR